MERELEIEKDDRCCDEKMRDPYEKASKNYWRDFKEFYDEHPDSMFSLLTVFRENAFHFAAASKQAKLVRILLGKLQVQSEKVKAITTADVHGNTPVHEVAKTNCIEAAGQMVEILFNFPSPESYPNTWGVTKKLRQDHKNLLIRNNLGESPLYRAAALGKTKMVQYLAKKIDPNVLPEHFIREDKISILHIAITGEHFDTAICLLRIEEELAAKSEYYRNEYYRNAARRLAKREEDIGMTCFNLVALMPLAFKRGRLPMGWLKDLVYSGLPTAYLSKKEDLKTGKNIIDIRQTMSLLKNREEDELPISCEGQDLESGNNKNAIRQPKKQTEVSKWIAMLMWMWIAIWRWLIEGWMKILYEQLHVIDDCD